MGFEGQPELVVDDGETGNGVFCTMCGSTPAVQVTFRAHRGLLVAMQFRKQKGPMCRDCGITVFRILQGDSLWQGWWGWLSVIITPFVLLLNLVARHRVSKLAAPLPGAPRPPLHPGTPLMRRPHVLGLLVPAAVLALTVVVVQAPARAPSQDRAAASSTSSMFPAYLNPGIGAVAPTTSSMPHVRTAEVGDCVRNRNGVLGYDSDPQMDVVPCDDPSAQARVLAVTLVGSPVFCWAHEGTDVVYTESFEGVSGWEHRLGELTVCLQTLR